MAGVDPKISQGSKQLQDLSTLDTCVTVVDCSMFQEHFKSVLIAEEHTDEKAIVQLLTEQIEFANVVLLNKCDLVDDETKAEVKNVARHSNLI